MGALKPWHIIVLVLLVLLLFGAGKLPGLARNLGKSMRIFKTEVEELRGDDKAEDEEDDYRPARRTDSRDSREADGRDRSYDPRDEKDERDAVEQRRDDDYRRD
ncbi:Sec-independent protein translocase subunit TatA [Brachybacterium hainanense]|uniref:Sec-independent protein translocase protein TatA n=1 Tax=Brachybacterium hainanense TaxID=1541174 RepID=A0ABV6RBC9_9MICO